VTHREEAGESGLRTEVPVSNPTIIVFGVNETLLDLDSIRPTFDRIFKEPAAMRLWFANLITYSEALTLAGVPKRHTTSSQASFVPIPATSVWSPVMYGTRSALSPPDGKLPSFCVSGTLHWMSDLNRTTSATTSTPLLIK
jgi:hypothetical protein